MTRLGWLGIRVLLLGSVLGTMGCGGPRDPVLEMQKALASAPEYMITLEDMREEGSFFPKYYHRYKVVQGERAKETGWVEVSADVFQRYEPFLGMALVAKSDQGVNNTPHPAGYHYVGNSQYGQWENRGGNSFWVFYGQYSLMRNMLGYGGRSIYRSDYDDYRSYRERRTPYFGKNREWGTSGSVTQQQKPSVFARRKAALAQKNRSFTQKVQSRTGRSYSGFGSRSRGGFGK